MMCTVRVAFFFEGFVFLLFQIKGINRRSGITSYTHIQELPVNKFRSVIRNELSPQHCTESKIFYEKKTYFIYRFLGRQLGQFKKHSYFV